MGFRVATYDQIRAEKESWKRPPLPINDFFDYAKALVTFMLDMANQLHLHKNDWHRTVFIDSGDVGTTDFKLPKEKIEMLYDNGVKGTKEYFKWFGDVKVIPINRL